MNSKHNLTILTKHQAIKMTWGANVGGKANANGVQFVPTPAINATLPPAFQVTAAKEVLVAAGAFGVSTYRTLCLFRGLTILQSPHFLELSGVGDPAILSAAGIPLKVDNPAVGTNLQDHSSTVQLYSLAATVPPANVTVTNSPGVGALVFPDIYETLGPVRAAAAGVQFFANLDDRAQAMVDSGAFTKLSGAKKMLLYQTTSIFVKRGTSHVDEAYTTLMKL
jgi:choline dehydrogenase